MQAVVFASNSITDGKKLMNSFCSLSPFLKEHYVSNSILKSGSMWFRVGDELKFLKFCLNETGKLSYNVKKDFPTDRGWFDLCDVGECSEIVFLMWNDSERHGLELRFRVDRENPKNGEASRIAFFFASQKERDQWADVLCLCAPHRAHRDLYMTDVAESEHYKDAVRKIQGATVRFVKWIASTREKALSRMFTIEADKNLKSKDAEKYRSTFFIGYGSAFILNGMCTANEGSEILHVSIGEWGLIERREHLRQVEKLNKFLEKLPSIKLATKKDLASLSSLSSVSRHSSGDIISVSKFGDKHIVLIREGVCSLGRKRLKNFKSRSNLSSDPSKKICSGILSPFKFQL